MKTVRVWRVEWFGDVDPRKARPKAAVFEGRDWADLEALYLKATPGMTNIRVVEADHEVPDEYTPDPRRVPAIVMDRAKQKAAEQ